MTKNPNKFHLLILLSLIGLFLGTAQFFYVRLASPKVPDYCRIDSTNKGADCITTQIFWEERGLPIVDTAGTGPIYMRPKLWYNLLIFTGGLPAAFLAGKGFYILSRRNK